MSNSTPTEETLRVEPTSLSQVFANREEAEWAFSFLRQVCETLDVRDSTDSRFWIDFSENGRFLIFGFNTFEPIIGFYKHQDNGDMGMVELPSFSTARLGSYYPTRLIGEFVHNRNGIHAYPLAIPISKFKTASVDSKFFNSALNCVVEVEFFNLAFNCIVETVENQTCLHLSHDPELAKAIFDESVRELILNSAWNPPVKEPEEIDFRKICRSVKAQKLTISNELLRRYHLSLKARKFVVLSGISGTGKTWLTEAYAKAIDAEYLLVPVAPNWTTNEDLLGYLNPINQQYIDTDFSCFLRQAAAEYKQNRDNAKPYHLVLDEMNLARVEYYFAKFLSAMEVRTRQGSVDIELSANEKVKLTPNLYFIGTINVDETTHGFADKIYDRAQLIELTVDRQQLYDHLGNVDYREVLMKIWDEMNPVAPFAFRVLDEIKIYIQQAEELQVSWQDALDEQILQKILPKLKGEELRVRKPLEKLIEIVEEKGLKLSLNKAKEMQEKLNHYGFTSYF